MKPRFYSSWRFFLVALAFVVQPRLALAAAPIEFSPERFSIAQDLPDNCRSPIDSDPATLAFSFGAVQDPRKLIGLYFCDADLLGVEDQPENNPAYVTVHRDAVTLFAPAANYGTIALLAHNDLSGKQFANLQIGEPVSMVYGDHSIRAYRVVEIRRFQALDPQNPYSDFVDLEHGSRILSSTQVFQEIFASGNRVVLQTCIEVEGDPAWGRLFVIATPFSTN